MDELNIIDKIRKLSPGQVIVRYDPLIILHTIFNHGKLTEYIDYVDLLTERVFAPVFKDLGYDLKFDHETPLPDCTDYLIAKEYFCETPFLIGYDNDHWIPSNLQIVLTVWERYVEVAYGNRH